MKSSNELKDGKWYHFKILRNYSVETWYEFDDYTGEMREIFTR